MGAGTGVSPEKSGIYRQKAVTLSFPPKEKSFLPEKIPFFLKQKWLVLQNKPLMSGAK
jgi:hypothetical protein